MRRALRHFGGRPRLTKLAQVLAKFGFHAPLLTTVVPAKGVGAASFTRTGTAIATVVDHEGAFRNCKVGEARFQRMRRVENLLPGSEFTSTIPAGWALASATYSNNTLTATGSGGRVLNSVTPVVVRGTRLVFTAELDAGTVNTAGLLIYDATALVTRAQVNLTLTGRKRYALEYTGWVPGNQCTCYIYVKNTSTAANGDTIKVYSAQLEDKTGAVNTNPSEYVSVGAPKANRLIETENFGAAAWLKSAATVAESAVRGPNGERAWETTWNAGGFFYQLADGGTGGSANETCYARVLARAVSTATKVGCRIDRNGVPQGNQQDYAITNSAWTEVLVGPFTLDANTASPALRFDHFDGNVILTRAQLVRGTTLPTYVPVGNVYPYHGACVDGVRYFETTNGNTVVNNVVVEGNGTALDTSQAGYLPEQASSNLCAYSSDFSGWTLNGTPTRVAAAAWCGDIALDLVGDDAAGAVENFIRSVTFGSSTAKAVSLVVKQDTSTSSVIHVRDISASADRLMAAITWSAGVPQVTYTVGSEARPTEALANGCYRIYCLTSVVTAANAHEIRFFPATTVGMATSNVGTVYSGGVQAEDGAHTSLIPTTTSTSSRGLDSLTYPTVGNVGAAGGTISGDTYVPNVVGGFVPTVFVSDGSMNERYDLGVGGPASTTRFTTMDGGTVQADTYGGTLTSGKQRCVGRYAANSFLAAGNGGVGTEDTAGTLPTVTTISVGIRADGSSSPVTRPVRHVRASTALLTPAEMRVLSAAA